MRNRAFLYKINLTAPETEVYAGLFDLCFTLIGRKLTGILMNVLLTRAGLFLIVTDTGIKWMFPSAHAVFAWHYDQMLNQTYCSVSVSIIYDLVKPY